ncbi:MAG: phenylacetate--CoA ligase family protein [Gammaproteobacteria bacterium]|nr:phenylacetate--CoA ligase family protein [Gammaproteobacteria bacterium]MYB38373.1 phenylacetate--CoA ligase family protein [Gammaproteobacteria bacterium]
MSTFPPYHRAADFARLVADHPIGTEFEAFARDTSRDELIARQDRLFRRCVARAWETGFYRRLWGAEGLEPGDIRGIEDLPRLPVFDKSDLMESIETHPPLGDFGGFDPTDPNRPPVVFHTTSGTTGRPQTLLFGPKSREAQSLILARAYRWQGMAADDVVHSCYGHGTVNGGHYVREAVLHWTNALFVSAGTGLETPSTRQVGLMRDFGATVLVGFGDYLKRLGEVAAAEGLMPGRDIHIRMISGHMTSGDKATLSHLWDGADCYDWYGVGDTGIVAAEGPDRDGLYLMEDAHVLELLDVDSSAAVAPGELGDMVCTCLFKDDIYPILRFNTHDVSRERTDKSAAGYGLRRIAGFLGRSDNMVKIKGINVFPHAIGPLLAGIPEFLGEFVCTVTPDGAMTVAAEVRSGDTALAHRMQSHLKAALGIEVGIELVAAGATANLTEVERRQKPIRLIDERLAAGQR